jgi:hypothetical protein
MGRFWGVLAGKPGVEAGKRAFCFALLHVLVVLRICKFLPIRAFRKIKALKKNRA